MTNDTKITEFGKIMQDNMKMILAAASNTLKNLHDDNAWKNLIDTTDRMVNGGDITYSEDDESRVLAFIRSPSYGWIKESYSPRCKSIEERLSAACGLFAFRLSECIELVRREVDENNGS